jgi:adenylosuccinate synthase
MVVFKAYVTRVGGGPLDNELSEEAAKKRGWLEFGSVTGRQRRAAPFDFNLAKKSIRLNSATQLAVTKLDVMFPGCAGATQYEKMPQDARKCIEEIEGELGVKVTLIGTGPDLVDVVDRR